MIIFLYIYNSKQLKRQTALREAEEENQRNRKNCPGCRKRFVTLSMKSRNFYTFLIQTPNELLFLNNCRHGNLPCGFFGRQEML